MISLLSAANIAISVAGMAIALLCLIQSICSRKIEGWNRSFFIVLFATMNIYIGSVLVYSVSTAMGSYGNVRVSETAMFSQSFTSSLLMVLLALMIRHFIWGNSEERLKKNLYLYLIGFIWLIYLVILSMTLFNERIYYFTPDNVYHRGPLYALLMIPPMIIMTLIFIALLRRKNELTRKQFCAMLIYILIAVICVPVQLALKGIMIIVFGTSIAGIIMFALLMTEQVEMNMKKTEEIADQRVQLLTLQMSPHFICNTLLSIYYLCDDDKDKAQKTILDFTDYLRKNYTAMTKDTTVPFSDELEHARAYAAVEKVRYEDMLEVVFDIKDEDFMLPPLTLQPLVENSVKHGIDPAGNVLNILVRAERSEEGYVVTVEDNGSDKGRSGPEGTHVAVKNITNRLKIMCNGSLELIKKDGGGAVVRIVIPDK